MDDGPYIGFIARAEHARAPWAPRKGRNGERRQDHHVYYWTTYDGALVEWTDSERELFKIMFQALGLSVADAIRLGSAWAQGPEDHETDFRQL